MQTDDALAYAETEGSSLLVFKSRHIVLTAYCILLLPILVFFFGWLEWYYALIAAAGLVIGFLWLYRSDYLCDAATLEVSRFHFIAIVAVLMFYVAVSGNCGIFWGQYDIPWRNAILRDLITFDWPVVYESTGFALCYYLVFWMIPGLVGKVLGWAGAMVALWAWQVFLMTTAFLLFAQLLKVDSAGRLWAIAVMLMLFSGLNLLGAMSSQISGYYTMDMSLNENYSGRFYYRSSIDCIEESYNQIVVWLAVPLMLQNRKMHSYLYLGLLVLPFSPWLTVGLIPFMVVLSIMEAVENAKCNGAARAARETLEAEFSPANLVGFAVCGIVFGSWFVASLHAGAIDTSGAVSETARGWGVLDLSSFGLFKWAGFLVFALCEFGIFALLIFKRNRRDPLYWAMVVWLLVCPFFWVGPYEGVDFGMDASLPGLCVLMYFLMEYFLEEVLGKPLGLRGLLYTGFVTIAFLGSIMQICSCFANLVAVRSISEIQQTTDITTYDGLPLSQCENFVCPNPEDTFFFTVLAK